jgi:PAS domain S-box-containing protein
MRKTKGSQEKSSDAPGAPGPDLQRVVEDLRTHQIELEMQNEELVRAQQLLADEKEKYCDLFDFAPVGFLVLDTAHIVTECNLTAAGMLAVVRSRVLGKPFRRYIAAEDTGAFDQLVLRAQRGQTGLTADVRVVRADGPMFHARLDAEPAWRGGDYVRLAMADIDERVKAEAALRTSARELEVKVQERTGELRRTVDQLSGEIAQRERRESELNATYSELDQRARQLQHLTSQLVQTEQRERKRIAQVLHDTLQQQLAAIRLMVGGLVERSTDAQWRDELVRAEEQIGDAIRTARTLTTELSPPALAQGGLIGGLEWLAQWMEQKHGLRVELSCENRALDMSEDTKMLLFDSVRELLFNVVKHARVPSARIGLTALDGAGLRITVSDQGNGFDPKALPVAGPEGGFGLFSIRERLQTFGGRLELESAVRKGSRFTIIIPQVVAGRAVGGRIRLMLADDHAAIREGLARLLGKEHDIEVVGQASDGEGAVDLALRLEPDVILMDIEMPSVDGVEATRRILPHRPHTKILGFSMHTEGELTQALLDAGAVGFLSKSSSLEELTKAIRKAMPVGR